MSSEEHIQEHVSSGKNEFTVGQLAAALKESQALVHFDVDRALAHESHDAVANAADWEKFYAAVNSVNAPVIAVNESPPAASFCRHRHCGDLFGHPDRRDPVELLQWLGRQGGRDAPNGLRILSTIRSMPTPSSTMSLSAPATAPISTACVTKTGLHDYNLRIGRIRYMLYAFRSDVFSLHGDGGFLNWAYIGRVVSADPDSRRPRNVVFRDI